MESQLANFEHKRGIKQRWKVTDKEYLDAQRSSLIEKKESAYSALRSSVVKRQYLLQLKAKYAGKQNNYCVTFYNRRFMQNWLHLHWAHCQWQDC